MDDTLKNKAYLEGQKLKKSGYDDEVIFARLEKQGIPEDLARQVIMNLSIQQRVEMVKEQTPFYNIALIKVGVGMVLAIVSYIIAPGIIILPLGFIATGIALAWQNKTT
jgi:hypothetical protein